MTRLPLKAVAPLFVLGGLLTAATGARAADCAALAGRRFPDARIDQASLVPAGQEVEKGVAGLPTFCRIKGVADQTIGFEVWLPADGWNGRLLSVGNAAFGGSIQYLGFIEGLKAGYAVTANDTGHQGQGTDWMGDPALVRKWGHSATHLVTGPSKAIVAEFYGAPARHAYFSGCSTGGAQAMEEAEDYPQDYDGIVAGAPGMSYARLMLSFLWGLKVSTAYPDSLLTPAKLQLLHNAVLADCDAMDGLVSEPLACHFEPKTLQCPGADAADCLTPHQVQTAKLLYQGPRDPRTGESIYPGMAYGSEAEAPGAPGGPVPGGWLLIQGPLAQKFAIPLMRNMIYHDPSWDWRKFDWDRDVADLDRRAANITAVSPDLRAFKARGGKLIMYQGWADPLNAQTYPIQYLGQVIDTLAVGARGQAAAATQTDGFYRLFMAPGMSHCIGGSGPSRFDSLSAIRAWVEEGKAPDRMTAVRFSFGSPPVAGSLSRPLCPFPQVARWSGLGSTTVAANFKCLSAPS